MAAAVRRRNLPFALCLLLPWACTADGRKLEAPPVVAFQAPLDGSNYYDIDIINFVGSIGDPNGPGDLARWTFTSDRDGLLGAGLDVPEDGLARLSRTLSLGVHSVTLTATDETGGVGTDVITVIVEASDQYPQAAILLPRMNDAVLRGSLVALAGAVSDPNDPPSALVVSWSIVSATGGTATEISSGPAGPAGDTMATWTAAVLGQFRARLVVADTHGNEAEDTVLFQVTDASDEDADGDGWSVNEGDCNDHNDAVFPEAPEFCGNAVDDDCNDLIDDRDADQDGHVDADCTAYTGPLPLDDCDDDDPTTYPLAQELLDGADNDCDTDVDEGTDAWDQDGDCVCVEAPCMGSDNPLCLVLLGGDCADDDADNFPGNLERCDGRDNDCDSAPDNGLPFADWWPDADGDGFGSNTAHSVRTCSGPPPSHVADHTDCDDAALEVFPGATEVVCDDVDNDCSPTSLDRPDGDADGVSVCLDCDDSDPNRFPGNAESCDGVDNDCNTVADDGLVFLSYFPDFDADGYGDSDALPVVSCLSPSGTVLDDTDCDDEDPDVNPGASEVICDSVDNDCNAATLDLWDLDGDGVSICDDCDDVDPSNFPGNPEVCDGADNDCNTLADDGIPFDDYYPDGDADGHGDPGGAVLNRCDPPLGYVLAADDCDDADPNNFPGNPEVCDGADNDCDTAADNGLVFTDWWPDVDEDGFGNSLANPYNTCDGPPAGVPRVSNGDDCDDDDRDNFPGNPEVCDGADNDCDGLPDNGC